jgi:hypothetical protein
MECNAEETIIWQVLTDAKNWNDWIGGLKSATIHGNFEDDTLITCENINMPKTTMRLKDVIANKSFITQSKLPFCTMDSKHEILKENDVLKIRIEIKLYGALTFIFKSLIGKSCAKSLPIAIGKLVVLAENKT